MPEFQAGEVARAALQRRVVEPVAAGALNHACRNAGFHIPVAEDHPGRVKAVGFGIARGEPVESLVIDGGPVVTPGVAVVQQSVAKRHADARLEILRIVRAGKITAAPAADKPFIRQPQHIIGGEHAAQLVFAGALLPAIIQAYRCT